MRDTPQDGSARTAYRVARPAAPITAGAVLAVALVISILGSLFTYNYVRNAFARHTEYEHARDDLSTLLRLQLDEETGLRGFLSTGQRVFLQPYDAAEPQEQQTYARLLDFINSAKVVDAAAACADLGQERDAWETQIALPLIKAPNAPDAIERLMRGKLLMDRYRADYNIVASVLDRDAQNTVDESFQLLRRASVITALLILLFGVAALVADAYRSRSQAALAREKIVADTLQRAFLSGWDVLQHLRIGTAYVSSTREAAVGGDLFDVHSLDDRRTMLLVADVSGKGLSAAVETAQVKYSIRTLADSEDDPGTVLARFNNLFLRSTRDPSAFVSIFLGILDDHALTLRYASAGHAPVYVRSGTRVSLLPVTGGLIGLHRDEPFESKSVQLAGGDILVLATDGLTEARDSRGAVLGDEAAMGWIARGNRDPQRLADEIVARLQRYGGGRIADDLALLVIRVQPAPVDAAPLEGAAPRRDVAPTPGQPSGSAP